ncbi:mechanosensitive ion channel family protein [Robertkochia marina]|uniref:Mechanosensitive ion channel family protein n=1 Tax=Robertkochia marina TaxID=1227945 RepID=A0A4S3LZ61_9FLAO|nr:mechanosensitive ion channel family protein [Robertkochia marina]THD65499.1 mechanosensitive ion channel family protein [Robertkochia marina]TRZ40853.1 mechanosensitive ion channel family protein [Robertkochia marina]
MKERLLEAWDKMLEQVGSWLEKLVVNLPNFVLAVIVFLLTYLASRYIYKLMLNALGRTSIQHSITRILSRLTSILVILFGLFLALNILHLNKMLTSLLAGAGVAGLAVGLALQGVLTNTFSGITLSFAKYMKLGDWIETNGFTGEVVDLSLRTTTIKQIDNNMVSIPNRLVIEHPLKNYSVTAQSRVILTCGVAYDSDLEMVRKVVKDTVVNEFEVVKDSHDLLFFYTEFGDSSINFELRFWIDSTSGLEILKARGEAIIAIKKAFDEHGITIPFPIRTIDFSNPLPKGTQE